MRTSRAAVAATFLVVLTILLMLVVPVRAASPSPDAIRIAVVSSYLSGEVQLSGVDWVIEQQGWLRGELAKRNIKLEWVPAPHASVGPTINEAFANKQIQFASYSDLPSIILNGSGGAQTSLLVPGNPGDSFLVVPANSTAKSIDDLKGKRLAIHKGRPWEIPLLRLLDSKGLSYNDFQIYNINPDAGATAVATGAIDGMVTVSAYALEEKGVAKIIWSTKEAPLDWKSWGGFWGARNFLKDQPELAQLVVTAYVKAAHWASQEENRDTIIKLGTRNGTVESIVRRTYDDPTLSWHDRWSPLFAPALKTHYRDAIAYAREKKIIRRDVDVDALLDPRLVQTALNELGLQTYWTQSKGGARAAEAAPHAAEAAK
jgi:sulfonate transport system substrate-binding protein